MKQTKTALHHSLIALLLCIVMLISSTFAWFTDSVSSGKNIITVGNLDLEMYWTDNLDSGVWYNVEENGHNTIFSYDNWEPGYTDVKYVKLVNAGSLALNYQLTLTPENGVGKLAEVINVYFAKGGVAVKQRADLINLRAIGLLDNVLNGGATADGTLLAKDQYSPLHPSGEVIMTVAMNMLTTAGNEYMNEDAGTFSITALATQAPFESDSFGNDYDTNAEYPAIINGTSVKVPVTPVDGKIPAGGVTLSKDGVSAFVPEGALVKDGATELEFKVTPLKNTTSDIITVNNEILIPVDVHIEGLADNNTVPAIIDLGEVLPKYLNMGNYRLFHVEDGTNNEMTLVADASALTAHNSFTYDPLTGEVVVAMASFSEVALLADTTNGWKGEFDYEFIGDGTKDNPYIIATADELSGFGAIVGGMNKQTQDSFTGKYIKLISDINIGDPESSNNPDAIFYPIGYYNSEGTYERTNTAITSGIKNFEGTFDGNGHTISNIYQNTWEMKGDHDWYTPEEQYYRDGMGIFGRVYKGTIKNLTVDNFKSDGEITTTGVIASYADGATFENIAITNCNPRVYNIGNGGIVGCVGWYAKDANLKTTFKNITVDNSNKISALWGSYDVACGGIVGQYYPTSGQTSSGSPKNAGVHFENCHVSAIMDVYNDVCGNYQYYAYRYAGMMIGSIRENLPADANGHIYPDMNGITAEGCTVHFGTWNDYYYCEFEKNGHPSYSGPDDYKFSRVPNEQIDTSNGKENATCIGHNHTTAEDNQAVYLPFNNLVTGYGWGVTTKAVGDMEGVTILDREEGKSVVKFEGKVKELANNNEYKIGDIFSFVNNGVELVPSGVTVAVNNLDEKNPVSAVFERNIENWENGTITFTGTGTINLTITDYYFCKPTTIAVNVTDRQPEVKFESKFTGDFLYRVGNDKKTPVALGSLFAKKDDVTIGNVSVTVEALNGTSASGTYTSNATWTNGTIQFSGTGVVKVTITDNDYCTPTELIVEVVDATNLTSATGTTTGGTFVLLSDVNTSAYVNYWNCTLYGNGFTYSLNGAPTAYNSKQGHGILITKNTTLDNLVIVGDVYNSYGAYTTQDCYNAAIDIVGDTTIQNCYISGCAAPVSTRANATITNTTLYGGAVANLLIKGGTVTLEDVTTANYNDGRNAPVGMGIVVHSDAVESAKLILNGTLTQYNFLNEEDTPTDTYAQNLHNTMFGSTLSKYHFGTSPNRRVNTGIVSLTALFNAEDIIDNANTGYSGTSVTLSGVDGYVYTQLNTSGSVNNDYDIKNDLHVSTTQGAVPPSYSFDYTTKNYMAKTDGSNDYCYEENGKVNISMDEGDTFNWDTSILTLGKGITNYNVSMNDTDYTGKSIAFNTADDYEVVYTYTDDNNYKFDENGNITTYSVTYTKTVNITVAVVKAATKHAEFTMGSSNAATEKITIDNATYVSATGVTADNSTWTYITINGQKIYYPIVAAKLTSTKGASTYAYFPVFENVVTITDYADNGTGDAFTYNSSTTTLPSNLTAVKGVYKAASDVPYWYNLTNNNLTQSGANKIFKWASSSDAPSDPTTYNNVLCYKSPQISADRVAYITLVQYSYTDEANTTYYYYVGYTLEAFTKQTTCVTADTLVTLADGSTKRIDEVSYNDNLLVWNFYEGKYDVAPIAIIFDHGADNNTVIKLNFNDGTTVKVVNMHQFFDANLNKLVTINEETVKDYVGHKFAKHNGNSTKFVELESYSVTHEYVEAWGIMTAGHYNIITADMISADFDLKDVPLFNYFEVGDDMKFDEDKMQADIEKYGLYTYEEFADYLTYEQFVAFNVQYFKIPVGKGLYTYEGIIELIEQYLK